MTPEEQKRDRLLKRVLPAMTILVIYFVFISGWLGESRDAAEQSFQRLRAKGINPNSVSGTITEQSKVQSKINQLKKKHKDLKARMSDMAGFLSNEFLSTESTGQLSDILASNQLQVINEKSQIMSEEEMTLALKDVWNWVKPMDENKTQDDKNKKDYSEVSVQIISVYGRYSDVYNALNQIAADELDAVPVKVTMSLPQEHESEQVASDLLKWELVLWM